MPKYAEILGIALLPLLIISFSVIAISSDTELMGTLVQPSASQATNQLLDYFYSDGNIPQHFNAQEASHLKDVRDVLQGFKWTFLITLTLLIFLLNNINAHKVLKYGGITTLMIAILLAIMPFEPTFQTIHNILFPQGNWMFPPESTLIHYYPAQFFITYSFIIYGAIILLSLITIFMSIVIKRR